MAAVSPMTDHCSVPIMRRRVKADARRTQHLRLFFLRFLSSSSLARSPAHYFLFPRRRHHRLTKICLLSLREEANAAVRPLLSSFHEGCGRSDGETVYYTCPSSQPLFISLQLSAALALLSV